MREILCYLLTRILSKEKKETTKRKITIYNMNKEQHIAICF